MHSSAALRAAEGSISGLYFVPSFFGFRTTVVKLRTSFVRSSVMPRSDTFFECEIHSFMFYSIHVLSCVLTGEGDGEDYAQKADNRSPARARIRQVQVNLILILF